MGNRAAHPAAMEKLPASFVFCDVEEMKYKEIAMEPEIVAGTVMSRVRGLVQAFDDC